MGEKMKIKRGSWLMLSEERRYCSEIETEDSFRIKNEIFFDDVNEHIFVIDGFYSVLDALEEE
jgi:hypothetical protein